MILFLLSLSMGLLDAMYDGSTSPLSNYQKGDINQEWIDSVNNVSFKNSSYTTNSLESTADDPNIFGNFRLGLSIFVTAFANATFALPNFMAGFGVPISIAFLISLPIWLVYFIGLVQFFAKYNFGGSR